MSPFVVCLTGFRASGKDYTAQQVLALCKHVHPDWVVKRYAIADEIKDELCRMHGEVDRLRLDTDREYKEKWRPLLIEIGGNGRAQHPDYWVNTCWNHITRDNPDVAVLTDVRFLNEFLRFRHLSEHVIVWRLVASDAVRKNRGWTSVPGIDTDPSETEHVTIPTHSVVENETEQDATHIAELVVQTVEQRRRRN